MFYLTSSLDYSQMMCAFLHFVCMLPACFLLPDNAKGALIIWKKTPPYLENKYDPQIMNSYVQMVKHEKTKWCLLLLLVCENSLHLSKTV